MYLRQLWVPEAALPLIPRRQRGSPHRWQPVIRSLDTLLAAVLVLGVPLPVLVLASAPALSAPLRLPPSALVLAVPAAGGQPAAVAPRTPDWFYAGQLLGNGVVGRDVCRVQSFLTAIGGFTCVARGKT